AHRTTHGPMLELVKAAIRCSVERLCSRKSDVQALSTILAAHGEEPFVNKLSVPRRHGRGASGENASKIGLTDGTGSILDTKTTEVETGDGEDVANARTGLASDHHRFFLEGELRDKVSCPVH